MTPRIVTLARDPKDEPYLNLAIASGAAFLVTWDNDLLDLMTDRDFPPRFPQLAILNPPALLRRLRAEGV